MNRCRINGEGGWRGILSRHVGETTSHMETKVRSVKLEFFSSKLSPFHDFNTLFFYLFVVIMIAVKTTIRLGG